VVRLAAIAVLFAGLVACLDLSDARPYDEFLADLERLEVDADTDADTDSDVDTDTDTDADTDVDTGPPFEPTLCSEDGGAPASVTFVNVSGEPGDLYWIPSDCSEVNIVLMPPGASETLNTFIGHAFWLRQPFEFIWLDEARVEMDGEVIEIGVPE
jgi:hypothetical protein